jgi:hypothetical protein
MIEREKKIVFKGGQYTIKFPNVGQTIDIESLKQALTNNRYGAMAMSNVRSMVIALDLVDAISFVQVMCPEISRTLPKNISYTNIDDPILASELSTLYRNQIAPWYNEILNQLQGITRDNSADKETDA